jgi:hypothetical protein
MPSEEDIQDQQKLLATHRRTLAHYLQREALVSKAHLPPEVAAGIIEARAQIKRTKAILRRWDVSVEDLPDDDPDPPEIFPARIPRHRSKAQAETRFRPQRKHILGAGIVLTLVLAIVGYNLLKLIPIASDDFNRADSANLGANWHVQKGTFEIRSNRLHLIAHDPTRIGDVDADIATWEPALQLNGADYDVGADVTMLGKTGDVFLMSRWQDMGNMYVVELSTYDQGVHIWRVVNGKLDRLKDISGEYKIGQTYNLRLSVQGSKLSAYVDGKLLISTEDANITSIGKPAVGTDVADVTWDNFAVYRN